MSGNQLQTSVFKSPSARLKLRDDFPPICQNSKQLIQTLKSELIKTGTTLEAVDTIHIAYPHKIPALVQSHGHSASNTVREVSEIKIPARWEFLDALEENVSLSRASIQNSVGALSARQIYSLNAPFSFTGDHQSKKYFIVADHLVDHGSTMAELINVITCNGGHVLAAYAGMVVSSKYLNPVTITDPYEYDRVNKPVDLQDIFSKSAAAEGLPYDGPACLQKFEAALLPFGMSIDAMTQGEKVRLAKEFRDKGLTFNQLCEDLKNAVPKPAPGSTCCP